MELTVHEEIVVVEEIKEVELRYRYAQFINKAACGEPSLRNEFNFFLWEETIESVPWDKMDKGMSWGTCSYVDHHVKKNIVYSQGQLERLYNAISDKKKTYI